MARTHDGDRPGPSPPGIGRPLLLVLGATAAVVAVSLVVEARRGDDGAADPPPAADDGPPPDPACSTASWPLERRARSLVVASIDRPSPDEVAGVVDGGYGGMFVGSGAVALLERGQVADAVADVELPPLVAVDEEGGRVQRLVTEAGPLPSARAMAAELSASEIRELARDHGRELRRLGVTVDFAPVLDVTDAPATEVIGDRSFGADPAVVTAAAGAFARGLSDAGVGVTFKHFPGHGRGDGDSHHALVTTPPIGDLDGDLAPYRELLADHPGAAVMVGHLVVPGLTDGEPASLSPEAVDGLLRGDLGFDGLVITDDLGGMRAILDRTTTREAAVRAVAAGVDLVLVPWAQAEVVADDLVAAVAAGTIDEDRLTRSADRTLTARLPDRCG